MTHIWWNVLWTAAALTDRKRGKFNVSLRRCTVARPSPGKGIKPRTSNLWTQCLVDNCLSIETNLAETLCPASASLSSPRGEVPHSTRRRAHNPPTSPRPTGPQSPNPKSPPKANTSLRHCPPRFDHSPILSPILTHYCPAMPFGNRKIYFRGSCQIRIVTI